MNTLYPIIRRVRRPLLPEDEPPTPSNAEMPPVIPPLPETPLQRVRDRGDGENEATEPERMARLFNKLRT